VNIYGETKLGDHYLQLIVDGNGKLNLRCTGADSGQMRIIMDYLQIIRVNSPI
jgi:hypothetical protein